MQKAGIFPTAIHGSHQLCKNRFWGALLTISFFIDVLADR